MWYVQKDVFGEEEETRLKETLDKLNIGRCDCDGLRIEGANSKPGRNRRPVFRGALEFVTSMSSVFDAGHPGVTPPRYRCSIYYDPWLPAMLNHDYFLVPWSSLEKHGNDYFETMACDKLFIRPNSGYKIFTGNYITKKWLSKDLEVIKGLPGNNAEEDTLVLVAPYQEIKSEFRCMMHRSKMVSYSYYSGEEMFGENLEGRLTRYVESAAYNANYFPDTYYTIDVAVLSNGELSIIELNSLFSAGWYDADYEKIVRHIRENF